MHETAMNNALAHMGLDGKRTDLPRLYRELADRFDQQSSKVPEDLPQDVIVQFAKEDSVRVRFENGRVTLVIRIVELSQGNSILFKNFVVRCTTSRWRIRVSPTFNGMASSNWWGNGSALATK